MKGLRRKWLSTLLCLGLLLTLFPQVAGAAGVSDEAELRAALAGSDSTITLTADIAITNTQTNTHVLTITSDVTLDLNGWELKVETGRNNSTCIKLNNGVTLTIMDSSTPSTGTLTASNTSSTFEIGRASCRERV